MPRRRRAIVADAGRRRDRDPVPSSPGPRTSGAPGQAFRRAASACYGPVMSLPVHPARGAASRSPVFAVHGMVAAAQPLATETGVALLRAGGSAVDAAIATNAVLALLEPMACGLGGDLFAQVWDPWTRRLVGCNASGRAPWRLTREAVTPAPDGTIPLRSPASWTTPGCADGWLALHARYGLLPLEQVLAPAIAYAEEGAPVSPIIAHDWQRAVDLVGGMPGFAEVFAPQGRAPRAGERFANPALAATLRTLAREGRGALLADGAIGAALVRYSDAQGGFFSAADFAAPSVTWDVPLSVTVGDVELWEMPPNSQGLAALQQLLLLEAAGIAAHTRVDADYWHLLLETKKLVYADRARFYADPAFASIPVEELLSPSYAATRAARIRRDRAAFDDPAGTAPALARGDTTYLCAADDRGLMVSWIQSNYTGFGSGHVVPALGYGLQNRGALFALDPAHANALEPGKRPFHTIIPAFVTRRGEPWLAFGVMGGDQQAQAHPQILLNLLQHGMNLQEAGDAPRVHHGGSSEPTGTRMHAGGEVHLEPGIAPQVAEELARRGHRLAPAPVETFGGYQALARDPDSRVYCGATESRKDGCAAGY